MSEGQGASARNIAADVVIIGAGIAGLVAANRLAALGRSVCALEKGAEEKYLCNSRITGGAVHVCYCDPTRPMADLRAAIGKATADTASPEMADAVAADAGRLVHWLKAEGISFARGGAEEYKSWVLTPLRPQRAGLVWEGLGGDVMMRRLEANFAGRGGRLLRGARAVSAERADDGWRVVLADGRTARCATLLIADGGFQGNADLVAKYITAQPKALVQRGAGTGCGDGLLIALSLGAASVGLERFYGHLLHADAFTNPKLWPFPWMDMIAASGIVVNAAGERFTDESKGGIAMTKDIARLADPLSAVAVFDEAVWTGPGATGFVAPNPHLKLGGATVASAGSIEQLAQALGLPASALTRAVAAHNAALREGKGLSLTPPRGGGATKAMPIEKPPFYAVRLAAGITYTMGGIAVDGHSRVLRADRTPIPGLYAAGATTGGLEGGPDAGYVGGLAKSGVTGLRAAEHIAGAA